MKICIIGAGPAGLMAAGRALEHGAQVTVYERNDIAGYKLLISGKGRCNLTNAADLPEFITAYSPHGEFLYGAFHQFFRPELLELLKRHGVETVTERGGRIFPVSQKSTDVRDALTSYASQAKMRYGQRVENILHNNGQVTGIQINSKELSADRVIITTGGKSYPGTGSTGDGYAFAEQSGHRVLDLYPALTPLTCSEKWIKNVQGLGLKNVALTIRAANQVISTKFGEMLFTHFGISGPIVLDASRDITTYLRSHGSAPDNWPEPLQANIDLKPALSDTQLQARLQRDFDQEGKKYFVSILKNLLPASLIPVFVELTGIPRDKLGNQINRQERQRLFELLRKLPCTITGLIGFKDAIITSGGVSLQEINPKTMESRLVKGLYFAGEVLDLDAPTGGYNLQAAFSTGWVAGEHASLSV
ncbi:MAG TPA: NAD(P)/FAD-dependent oxidoreductase [bacterium]|nr:NAD(P)/FAD-dependent oxidoreductase [bacterium]